VVLTLDQFRLNFVHDPVPTILEDLLAFQNLSDEWYSLAFELSSMPCDALSEHVQKEHLEEFFCIGHDGNYSIYALWRYKDIPLDAAPIVYFNSEAEGSTVLANNLSEFLRLLAYGAEPIFGVYPEKIGEGRVHATRNQEFKGWIHEKCHLQVSRNPNEIVHDAQQQHPALPLIYA
jgi:hypothetical protein